MENFVYLHDESHCLAAPAVACEQGNCLAKSLERAHVMSHRA